MKLLNRRAKAAEAARAAEAKLVMEELGRLALTDVEPIDGVRWRRRVKVAGRVRAMRVQPWAEIASLELTLGDGSASITVVFLGRRQIPGIRLGSPLVVEGMVSTIRGQLAIMNPEYQLLPPKIPLPAWDA
jgi:RecG-like helicase